MGSLFEVVGVSLRNTMPTHRETTASGRSRAGARTMGEGERSGREGGQKRRRQPIAVTPVHVFATGLHKLRSASERFPGTFLGNKKKARPSD